MKDATARAVHTAPVRTPDPGRGNTLGRALWLCDWLQQRRFPFTAAQLATAMEASKRTALRWLEVAESVGLVDCDRTGQPWRWRTRSR